MNINNYFNNYLTYLSYTSTSANSSNKSDNSTTGTNNGFLDIFTKSLNADGGKTYGPGNLEPYGNAGKNGFDEYGNFVGLGWGFDASAPIGSINNPIPLYSPSWMPDVDLTPITLMNLSNMPKDDGGVKLAVRAALGGTLEEFGLNQKDFADPSYAASFNGNNDMRNTFYSFLAKHPAGANYIEEMNIQYAPVEVTYGNTVPITDPSNRSFTYWKERVS